MKTSLTILGLVVVLLAAIGTGYLLMRQPTASPTPTPDDTIVITAPMPQAVVSSPLRVAGRARGTWYFEASFPVVLTNASGTVIAQVPAQAQGDWMTTAFVPFEATLTFASQSSGTVGSLILKKDNPSGLPENDDSRTIPVVFK